MIRVILPDGKVQEHPPGTTVLDVLRGIGPRLARDAVAARINGAVVDLATPLHAAENRLEALKLSDADGLNTARHSCAHVMAEAICALWPSTKLVYGPPVENGFYYDIDLEHPISTEDFAAIEAKMAEIVKQDRPFTRYEMKRGEAMPKLAREGNEYKIDNAERADGDVLSFYVSGAANSGCFEDLCRGPHVPSTGRVGAFKLTQVAGAYHHGDASKKMLQRIYGTSWATKADLDAYLKQLEEARKRDHRKLGHELNLFTIDPLVGSGLVLWKPRGAKVRLSLETLMREQLVARGYEPVYTPQIGRLDLYRTSGHYPYYKDAQFPPMFESEKARELNALWELARTSKGAAGTEERKLAASLADRFADLRDAGYALDAPVEERLKRIRTWLQREDGFLLRPMNCPHHIRLFASDAHSYRQLPVRLAEFGTVYRYEQSGELGGMTRVRGFTQDDAHLFCTEGQLQQEMADCVDLTRTVLKLLDLRDFRVRVGLRGDGDKYIGTDENWAKAEEAVRRAVRDGGLPFTEERGEAAFYGPKVDFVVRDCIGREWQLGTVQADYSAPERFDLRYVGEDNREHRPVMIHRAPFGSLERFTAILIEHFAGAFPTWLAPEQALICSVSEKSAEYAARVTAELRAAGLRAVADLSNERIGAKIRAATLLKVPYILVVGEQEAARGTLNVRTRDGRQLGDQTVAALRAALVREVAQRELHVAGGTDQPAPTN